MLIRIVLISIAELGSTLNIPILKRIVWLLSAIRVTSELFT